VWIEILLTSSPVTGRRNGDWSMCERSWGWTWASGTINRRICIVWSRWVAPILEALLKRNRQSYNYKQCRRNHGLAACFCFVEQQGQSRLWLAGWDLQQRRYRG